MKKLNPIRHPVTGEVIEYRPSANTDIAKTFERVVKSNPVAAAPVVSKIRKIK
jgi:hypothetical protein